MAVRPQIVITTSNRVPSAVPARAARSMSDRLSTVGHARHVSRLRCLARREPERCAPDAIPRSTPTNRRSPISLPPQLFAGADTRRAPTGDAQPIGPRSQGRHRSTAAARFMCCKRFRPLLNSMDRFPRGGNPWPSQQWQSEQRGQAQRPPSERISTPRRTAGNEQAFFPETPTSWWTHDAGVDYMSALALDLAGVRSMSNLVAMSSRTPGSLRSIGGICSRTEHRTRAAPPLQDFRRTALRQQLEHARAQRAFGCGCSTINLLDSTLRQARHRSSPTQRLARPTLSRRWHCHRRTSSSWPEWLPRPGDLLLFGWGRFRRPRTSGPFAAQPVDVKG